MQNAESFPVTLIKSHSVADAVSTITAQKMKLSMKDFFSKCNQIRRKLRIWSHLLKKSSTEKFIFLCNEFWKFLEYLQETFAVESLLSIVIVARLDSGNSLKGRRFLRGFSEIFKTEVFPNIPWKKYDASFFRKLQILVVLLLLLLLFFIDLSLANLQQFQRT